LAELEILDVVPAPLPPKRFWGGSLDLPVEGERRSHFAIVVTGWVLRTVDLPPRFEIREAR
jgi:hypothetical protein